MGARDEDRSAGAGAGSKEQGRKCRHGGGHEGTGAEVPARRRTREQGKDRSAGAEAGTGRGGSERRHGRRAGGTDSMTGSKHKLIREEKRKRKRKKDKKKQGTGSQLYIQDATVSPRPSETSVSGRPIVRHRSQSITRRPDSRGRVISGDPRVCAVTGWVYLTTAQTSSLVASSRSSLHLAVLALRISFLISFLASCSCLCKPTALLSPPFCSAQGPPLLPDLVTPPPL